jgi:hypothetical protein
MVGGQFVRTILHSTETKLLFVDAYEMLNVNQIDSSKLLDSGLLLKALRGNGSSVIITWNY